MTNRIIRPNGKHKPPPPVVTMKAWDELLAFLSERDVAMCAAIDDVRVRLDQADIPPAIAPASLDGPDGTVDG